MKKPQKKPLSTVTLRKSKVISLRGDGLTLKDLFAVAVEGAEVELDETALEAVRACRRCVERRLQSGGTFYGINTGFGYLSDVTIDKDKLAELQVNLIRSHACGVDDPLPQPVVRGVLALRIQTMLRGNSGVRSETIELMRDFLNHRICPVIPSRGSVGASGDLAPLAHLALALIGEGEVLYRGKRRAAHEVLSQCGLEPLQPEPKEGLCLINGTQVMTAMGLLAAKECAELVTVADIAAAMTLDATRGTPTAFRPEIHRARPHPGAAVSAQNVMNLLEDDEIAEQHRDCPKVQDPYSIRCTPQVHGAVRQALSHTLTTLEIEANSSTDNPLVFPETDEILSGGNFHGEPVAIVLDYLGIAASELASISERRTEKLINPHMSGLPPFLARNGGLNSGHMITHVVSAALVSENKVLAHPASVDSIATSADKEDHVSMGMAAALKLCSIIRNASHVLAIELLAACDALDFHIPTAPGAGVQAARGWVRRYCEPLTQDRSLSSEIGDIAQRIKKGELRAHVEKALGKELL